MMRHRYRCFLMLCSVEALTRAAVAQVNHETFIPEVRQAMKEASSFMRSISTEGGYVYSYAATNLQIRRAEDAVTLTEISIQLVTPTMGKVFLELYDVTKDFYYLDASRAAAMALVRCQLPSGGWHYTGEFDPAKPNVDGMVHYTNTNNWKFGQFIKHTEATMLDDNTTQSAVNFLILYADKTRGSNNPEDRLIREAMDRALLDGMIGAQYPNGAWPQVYRGLNHSNAAHFVTNNFDLEPTNSYEAVWPGNYGNYAYESYDYTPFYTQNDNCISDCIQTMLFAWKTFSNSVYLASATNGAEFLVQAQFPAPQQGWAQQYNFKMEAAWARQHEVPSLCSCESGGAVEALLDVYKTTNVAAYLTAASNAVVWLKEAAITTNLWTRYYKLGLVDGTNLSVYGDSSGLILTNVPDPYMDDYEIPKVIAYYDRVSTNGSDPVPSPINLIPAAANAQAVMNSMDGGRWITPDTFFGYPDPMDAITVSTFVASVRVLNKYLRATNSIPDFPAAAGDAGTNLLCLHLDGELTGEGVNLAFSDKAQGGPHENSPDNDYARPTDSSTGATGLGYVGGIVRTADAAIGSNAMSFGSNGACAADIADGNSDFDRANTDFTVSLWYKPNFDYDADSDGNWLIGKTGSDDDRGWQLFRHDDSRKVTFTCYNASNGSSQTISAAAGGPASNKFTHIAVTFDGDHALRMYFDGVEAAAVTSGVLSVLNGANSCPLQIGNRGCNSGDSADGILDDVGLWKETLSPRQIAAIHALGRFGNLDLGSGKAANLLNVFDAHGAVKINGSRWEYTTNLMSRMGTAGGDYAITNYSRCAPFVVLDHQGNGMVMKPATLLLHLDGAATGTGTHAAFADKAETGNERFPYSDDALPIHAGTTNTGLGIVSGITQTTNAAVGDWAMSFTAANTRAADIADGNPDFDCSYSNFTVSLWYKPNYDMDANSGGNWLIGKMGGDDDRGWQMLRADDSSQVTFVYYNASNGLSQSISSESVGPSSNNFTHIAVTFAGGQALRMYLNGTEVTSQTNGVLSVLNGANSCPLQIGNRGCNSGDSADGIIDDVGIWKATLSAEQIGLIYSSRAAGLDLQDVEIAYEPVYTVTGEAAYITWRQNYFTADQLNDSAAEISSWGDWADPDRDGLPNLLEYAFALDPVASNQCPRPVSIVLENGWIKARFLKSKQASADSSVSVGLQKASGLKAESEWLGITSADTLHEDLGDTELREVILSSAGNGESVLFVRLYAARLEN